MHFLRQDRLPLLVGGPELLDTARQFPTLSFGCCQLLVQLKALIVILFSHLCELALQVFDLFFVLSMPSL